MSEPSAKKRAHEDSRVVGKPATDVSMMYRQLTRAQRMSIVDGVARWSRYAFPGRDVFVINTVLNAGLMFAKQVLEPMIARFCQRWNLSLENLSFSVQRVRAAAGTMLLLDRSAADLGDPETPQAVVRAVRKQVTMQPHIALVSASFFNADRRVYLIPRELGLVLCQTIMAHCMTVDRRQFSPAWFANLFNNAWSAEQIVIPRAIAAFNEGVVSSFFSANIDMEALLQSALFCHLVAPGARQALSARYTISQELLERIDAMAPNSSSGDDDDFSNQGAVRSSSGGGGGGGAEILHSDDSNSMVGKSKRPEFGKIVNYSSDGRRQATDAGVYIDRTLADGANKTMCNSLRLIYSLAFYIFADIGQRRTQNEFNQVYLFYAHQLAMNEWHRNARTIHNVRALRRNNVPPAQGEFEMGARLVDDARHIAQRIGPLLQLDNLELFATQLASAAHNAIYICNDIDRILDDVFEHIDVAALVAIMQRRRDAPVRSEEAVIAPCEIVSYEYFEKYCVDTAQRHTLHLLHKLEDAEHNDELEFDILRIPLNTNRAFVGGMSSFVLANEQCGWEEPDAASGKWPEGRRECTMKGREHHAANRATPQSVQASVLMTVPGIRDGHDFLTAYTPLSAMPRANHNLSYERNYDDEEARYEQSRKVLTRHLEIDAGAADASTAKRGRGRPRKHAVDDGVKIAERAYDVSPQPTLADPAYFLWVPKGVTATLEAQIAPMVLLQRATGRAQLNPHMPLTGPVVAELLASSNELTPLCTALNALSGMLGLSAREWDAEMWHADKFAIRVARLATDITTLYAQAFGGGAFSETFFLETTVFPLLERYTAATALDKAARGRTCIPNGSQMGGALAVVLNCGTVPVACGTSVFEWLRDTVCAGDERLQAHLRRCDDVQRRRTYPENEQKWRETPRFFMNSETRQARRQRVKAERDKSGLDRLDESRRRSNDNEKDKTNHSIVRCRCGVELDLCAAMLKQHVVEGDVDLTCCICAGDSSEVGLTIDNLPMHSIMTHACSNCHQRLPWRRIDGPELLVINHIEIYTPPEIKHLQPILDYQTAMLDPNTVTHWTLIERVVAHAAANPGELGRAIEFFDSLCFRQLRWRTAPVEPLSFARSRNAQSHVKDALAEYSAFVIDKLERREAVDATTFREWQALPMTRDARMSTAAAELLFSTEALKHASAPPADYDAPRPGDAMAQWLSAIEMAAEFACEKVLELARNARLAMQLSDVPAVCAFTHTLRKFLIPFGDAASLHRYQASFAKHVGTCARYLPLYEPPLAESTAMGADSANSVLSEQRQDIHSRLDNLLTRHGLVRPLSAMLPLTAELLFVNYHHDDHLNKR